MSAEATSLSEQGPPATDGNAHEEVSTNNTKIDNNNSNIPSNPASEIQQRDTSIGLDRTSSSITSNSKSHKRSRSSDRHRDAYEDSPNNKENHHHSHRSRRSRSRSIERSQSPSYPYDSDRDREGRSSYRGSSSRRDRERDRSGRDRSSRHSSSRRDRDRRHDSDRDHGRDRDRRSRRGGRGRDRDRSLSPADAVSRDRRTVFVQQLAARLRTHELVDFFEQAGPVRDASIVKDKVSGRSKGVAYVEFKDVDSVPKAINLTGEKLLGIPVIVQFTESEKNRQAQIQLEAQNALNAENSNVNDDESVNRGVMAYPNNLMAANAQAGMVGNAQRNQGPPECRIYVGNINFDLNEPDIQPLFEGFGTIQYIHIQRDPTGKSKGFGFIQYTTEESAKTARERMNGFSLLGRPLRVGRGGDRSQGRNNMVGNGLGPMQGFPGSSMPGNMSYAGRGGSGVGGGEGPFTTNASVLDDTEVSGITYSNSIRDNLMRNLMRKDDNLVPDTSSASATPPPPAPVPQKLSNVPINSRYVLIQNMFDPSEESGDTWVQELEEDVKEECEDKYGKVVHVAVDPASKGEVYLKFADEKSAENAVNGLDGRFFGGKKLSAQPLIEMMYAIK